MQYDLRLVPWETIVIVAIYRDFLRSNKNLTHHGQNFVFYLSWDTNLPVYRDTHEFVNGLKYHQDLGDYFIFLIVRYTGQVFPIAYVS